MRQEYVNKLARLNMNTIVSGCKNSGKKSIIHYTFPDLFSFHAKELEYSNVSKIAQGVVFTGRNVIMITGISNNAQGKRLCCFMDRFPQLVFIYPVNGLQFVPLELLSRCALFILPVHSQHDISQLLATNTSISNDAIIRISQQYRTPHDALLAAELASLGLDTIDISHWHGLIDKLVTSLRKASHSHIRSTLTRVLISLANPTDVFHRILHVLDFQNTHLLSAVSLAAKYEHQCKLGNKPLYHLEAFVYALKDLMTSSP